MQPKITKHFKLKEMPFEMTADPRFLFLTPQHRDALDWCQYIIGKHGGLVVVYGEIGMGKTTLSRRLYEMNRDKNLTAMLVTPDLKTETALLRAIMEGFGAHIKHSYAESLRSFLEFIIESKEDGKNLVLIVDEAQKLTPKMLSVIHSLLNFESNTDKFLQIVLFGQKELATNIDAVPALKSRVARFNDLPNLNEYDTREMIAARWNIASGGKASDPFTEEALLAIYVISKGLPREIVKLADGALLNAFAYGVTEVTKDHVLEAADGVRLPYEGSK